MQAEGNRPGADLPPEARTMLEAALERLDLGTGQTRLLLAAADGRLQWWTPSEEFELVGRARDLARELLDELGMGHRRWTLEIVASEGEPTKSYRHATHRSPREMRWRHPDADTAGA